MQWIGVGFSLQVNYLYSFQIYAQRQQFRLNWPQCSPSSCFIEQESMKSKVDPDSIGTRDVKMDEMPLSIVPSVLTDFYFFITH